MSAIMTIPYLWFLTKCTSFSFTIRYQVFRFSSSLVLGVREALETRLLGFVNTFRLVKVKMRICKYQLKFFSVSITWMACVQPSPPLRKKWRKSLRGGDGCTQYYLLTEFSYIRNGLFQCFTFVIKQILVKLYFRANFIAYQSFLNKSICIHTVSEYSFE